MVIDCGPLCITVIIYESNSVERDADISVELAPSCSWYAVIRQMLDSSVWACWLNE